MYSHGSSARVGVGRRGPGGRNYRPPKERNNDPNVLVPPPLKACDCMIQLDLPEYAELGQEIPGGQQRRRLHLCFAGNSLNERKKSLTRTEKNLRSKFGVHLVVPGRNQTGPLAVVGKSIQQALPAVDYLMTQLVLENINDSSTPSFLNGRIMRNVKDPNDIVLSGRFLAQNQQQSANQTRDEEEMIYLQPYWLFESDSWSAMVCPLSLPLEASPSSPTSDEANPLQEEQQIQRQSAIAEALQISFDNLRFRIGNAALSELNIFLHAPPASASQQKAFAMGDPSGGCLQSLYQEIRQTKVVLPKAPSVESEAKK